MGWCQTPCLLLLFLAAAATSDAGASTVCTFFPTTSNATVALGDSKKYERYHMGPVLTSTITVHPIWYGRWSSPQKRILRDFLRSITPSSPRPPTPSVADWWRTVQLYADQINCCTIKSTIPHRPLPNPRILPPNPRIRHSTLPRLAQPPRALHPGPRTRRRRPNRRPQDLRHHRHGGRRSPTPRDMTAFLRLYCRRMDLAGLWRLIVSRRKDPLSFWKEIADAVSEAVDPPRLVLDSVADFLNHQAGEGEAPVSGHGDRYWGPRMLLWALFDAEGKKAQEVSEGIKERAVVVAEMLKRMVDEKEIEWGVGGGSNGQMFLQMVVAFGLSEKFETGFLRKLILEHAWRKQMAKLAVSLGFGVKMPGALQQ